MNILVIADDEFLSARIREIQADLLISCGDLPDDLILQVAARCRCREILAVKGNHDSSAPFRSPIRDLHLITYPTPCRRNQDIVRRLFAPQTGGS